MRPEAPFKGSGKTRTLSKATPPFFLRCRSSEHELKRARETIGSLHGAIDTPNQLCPFAWAPACLIRQSSPVGRSSARLALLQLSTGSLHVFGPRGAFSRHIATPADRLRLGQIKLARSATSFLSSGHARRQAAHSPTHAQARAELSLLEASAQCTPTRPFGSVIMPYTQPSREQTNI